MCPKCNTEPENCPNCQILAKLAYAAEDIWEQVTTNKLDPADTESNRKLRDAYKLIWEAINIRERENQSNGQ